MFSIAQSQLCDCASALREEVISIEATKEEILHYINTIDKKTYSETQLKGKINAVVPVENIPIGFDGSFEDFDRQRKSIFRSESFNYSINESIQFLRKRIPERGYESFDRCMDLCLGAEGLFLYIIDSDSNDIIIEVVYRGHATGGAIYPLQLTGSSIINGIVRGNEKNDTRIFLDGDSLAHGVKKHFIIRRENKNEALFVKVASAIGDKTMKFPPYPKAKTHNAPCIPLIFQHHAIYALQVPSAGNMYINGQIDGGYGKYSLTPSQQPENTKWTVIDKAEGFYSFTTYQVSSNRTRYLYAQTGSGNLILHSVAGESDHIAKQWRLSRSTCPCNEYLFESKDTGKYRWLRIENNGQFKLVASVDQATCIRIVP